MNGKIYGSIIVYVLFYCWHNDNPRCLLIFTISC